MDDNKMPKEDMPSDMGAKKGKASGAVITKVRPKHSSGGCSLVPGAKQETNSAMLFLVLAMGLGLRLRSQLSGRRS
jgi:hypothetical protein